MLQQKARVLAASRASESARSEAASTAAIPAELHGQVPEAATARSEAESAARTARTDAPRVFEVIGNDVELVGAARALIVSGPNAGGKTVTITAVGLAALMARAGLPIPASRRLARCRSIRSVLTAIGDEQDS